MASIKPYNGTLRATIKRKGHPIQVKTFPNTKQGKRDADHWASEQERSIRLAGLPLTIEQLKNITLGDLVHRYIETVTPTKGSAASETNVLSAFAQRDICKLSGAVLSMPDAKKYAYQYAEQRVKETWIPKGAKIGRPVTVRTVRRELNSISNVFTVARERWGYTNLVNPLLKDRKYCRKEYPLPGHADNTYRLTVGIDDALQAVREYAVTHKVPMPAKLQFQQLLNKHNIKE